MDNQKQELITKLRDANNILVTVSSSPSVDQLAACIGLTLLLNKLGKHATAVFSGEVPSTLQFLKPEDTLEKNTDSLRDFIVSLDKAKADKLRYKVEDNVVKIFITPYKTSITQDDLDFSQGDFNIDVVVCLGVDNQADLDQAIVSHGRILHDATVAAVSIGTAGELGTLNWVEPRASSLSELAAQIGDTLGREQLDGQIATAFLTGIVAETDRFSNVKTSPVTMQLSAQLMAAGANQQLVASELQSGISTLAIDTLTLSGDEATDTQKKPDQTDDGTLEIGHNSETNSDEAADTTDDQTDQDPEATAGDQGSSEAAGSDGEEPASRLILQPPSLGGTLTANSAPESFDPSIDPLTLLNQDTPLLSRSAPVDDATDSASDDAGSMPAPQLPELPAVQPLTPAELGIPAADSSEKSLADLEVAVDSPHLHAVDGTPAAPETAESLDAARDAVLAAVNSAPAAGPLPPTQAAGAEGYLNVQDIPDTTVDMSVDPTQDLTIPPVDPMPPTSTDEPASTAPPVPPPLPLDPTQFTAPK